MDDSLGAATLRGSAARWGMKLQSTVQSNHVDSPLSSEWKCSWQSGAFMTGSSHWKIPPLGFGLKCQSIRQSKLLILIPANEEHTKMVCRCWKSKQGSLSRMTSSCRVGLHYTDIWVWCLEKGQIWPLKVSFSTKHLLMWQQKPASFALLHLALMPAAFARRDDSWEVNEWATHYQKHAVEF